MWRPVDVSPAAPPHYCPPTTRKSGMEGRFLSIKRRAEDMRVTQPVAAQV